MTFHKLIDRKLLVTSAIVTLGITLRALAARGDLWLDEIWSLRLAKDISSPAGVLDVLHDNNHPLNTLWMWFVGPDRQSYTYRMPALFFGSLSVVLVAFLYRDRWPLSPLMISISYPLIHYSSEARGYGPTIFLAIAAWHVAGRIDDAIDKRTTFLRIAGIGLIYLSCCVVGLLFHTTFAFVIAGCSVRNAYQVLLRPRLCSTAMAAASINGTGLLLIVFHYFTFASQLEIGGGDEFTTVSVTIATLSLSIGGPSHGLAAIGCAFISIACFAVSMKSVFRRSAPEAVFLLTTVGIAPIFSVVAFQPEELFERYFLLPILFFQLALSNWISAKLKSRDSRCSSLPAIIVLTVFVVANCCNTIGLVRFGRGSYAEAVSAMLQETPTLEVKIGSDHDFRNGLLLSFFAPTSEDRKTLRYFPTRSLSETTPEWIVRHTTSESAVPPNSFKMATTKYRIFNRYPYWRLSGFSWHLYRRE